MNMFRNAGPPTGNLEVNVIATTALRANLNHLNSKNAAAANCTS